MLSNLNKLVNIPADANGPAGQLWLYGTGGFRFFQGTGRFTSPPEDNGTLVKNDDGSFTYTTPEQVKIEFDSSGKQTAWKSPDGKEVISFSYTGDNLTGLTAIDGSSSTFTYLSGVLASISVPGSRTFTTTITSGDLTQVTDPDARVHNFTYDGSTHRLTKETLGSGTDQLENNWSYTSSGVLATATWGETSSPSVTTFLPAATRGLTSLHAGPIRFQDALGRTTSWTRDAQGYVTREDLPDTRFRTWTYDPYGHTVDIFTNERGYQTNIDYDAGGHIDTITNAKNEITDYSFDLTTGLLQSITDGVGNVTSFTWDANRRLKTTTDVLGTTEYFYDSRGHEDFVRDAKLRDWQVDYDAMEHLLSSTDPAGNSSTNTWTSAGLLSQTTNREGVVTTNQFDPFARGLLEVVTEASGTDVARTSVSQFDAKGQTTGSRNALGYWTTMTLDSVGQAIETIDPQGNVGKAVFDLAGQHTHSRDALGFWSEDVFNARGWITQHKNPDSNTVSNCLAPQSVYSRLFHNPFTMP